MHTACSPSACPFFSLQCHSASLALQAPDAMTLGFLRHPYPQVTHTQGRGPHITWATVSRSSEQGPCPTSMLLPTLLNIKFRKKKKKSNLQQGTGDSVQGCSPLAACKDAHAFSWREKRALCIGAVDCVSVQGRLESHLWERGP